MTRSGLVSEKGLVKNVAFSWQEGDDYELQLLSTCLVDPKDMDP